MWDHQQLHEARSKTKHGAQKNSFLTRQCLFCSKRKTFVSRGGMCTQHLLQVHSENVQVPCTGLKACGAFSKNGIVNPVTTTDRPHYVCTTCFESHGGHLFIRSGIPSVTLPKCTQDGRHDGDTTRSLEAIGKWILTVASTANVVFKNQLLESLIPIIHQTGDNDNDAPSHTSRHYPACSQQRPSYGLEILLLK